MKKIPSNKQIIQTLITLLNNIQKTESTIINMNVPLNHILMLSVNEIFEKNRELGTTIVKVIFGIKNVRD